MRRRLRSEAGQTAAEYLGALLILSVIVAAVVVTDVGRRIDYHARILICRIAGGSDCDAAAGNPDAPALARCVVKSSDKSLEASVKVLVFKLEGGVAGTKRVSADGTTFVTMKANGGAGLEFSTPGVEAGSDETTVESPKGEFSVSGKGEFARTWKFASEKDADDFIGHVVDKVKAKADMVPNFLQGADDYDLPGQDSDTISGAVNVSGSAAGLSGGIEAGLGARYFANGDKTYFFRAKASAGAAAGGFGIDGDGEVVIGITYDKNGQEQTMSVTGVGTVSGGLELHAGAENLSGLFKAVGGGAKGQIAKRVEFESTLDLVDAENRAAARAFLDGQDPTASRLIGRFDAAGQTNVRLYDVVKLELGVDVDGSVVGFSAKYAQSDARLTNAWFDPGPGGFEPWFDCAQAGV